MISTSHLRSFCISFLLLSFIFTAINFLTTTTTIHKSTTSSFLIENNLTSSSKSTKFPESSLLLALDPNDVHHHQFYCYRKVLAKKSTQNTLLSNITHLRQPDKNTSTNESIPYNYKLWKSAPFMPRLVSECEHQLMIQLLKRFDQLTRKYSLDYMMIDGTLLGSWRHHDLIPWDDDVDLMMSIQLKDRLNQAIQHETSTTPYYVEFHRRWDAPKEFEYYKFYFSISPRFSEYPWRYPFVDLIFYHENETHIWQENLRSSTSVSKNHVFPLKYRPFGPLWLPAPYSTSDYFHEIGWTNPDQQCLNGPWSHKYETTKDFQYDDQSKSIVNCQELETFYPFVKRSQKTNDEQLIINGTVQQIIEMINKL